jgi:hypothetical protein
VLLTALAGLDAVQHRRPLLPALWLTGVMLGEAAATKYQGALFGVIGLAGVAVAADRSILTPRALAALTGGAAAIAVPWYLWTWHTTGDPVYPLATSVFGNRRGLWNRGELNWQFLVARSYVPPGIPSIFHRAVSFLEGKALSGDIPLGRSALSWFLGAGVLGLFFPSAWRDRTFLGSLVAALLSVLALLNISADPRYAVPAVGLVALCGGLAADHALALVDRRIRKKRAFRFAVATGWVVVVAGILHSPASYARDSVDTAGTPPTGSQAVFNYLAVRIPCYPAIEYLNHRYGSAYRAWGYICEEARYFAKGLLIGDVFSTGSRRRVFDDQGNTLPDTQDLWRRLAPLRVRWVILPTLIVPYPSVLETHGLFKLDRRVLWEYIFEMQDPQGPSRRNADQGAPADPDDSGSIVVHVTAPKTDAGIRPPSRPR